MDDGQNKFEKKAFNSCLVCFSQKFDMDIKKSIENLSLSNLRSSN